MLLDGFIAVLAFCYCMAGGCGVWLLLRWWVALCMSWIILDSRELRMWRSLIWLFCSFRNGSGEHEYKQRDLPSPGLEWVCTGELLQKRGWVEAHCSLDISSHWMSSVHTACNRHCEQNEHEHEQSGLISQYDPGNGDDGGSVEHMQISFHSSQSRESAHCYDLTLFLCWQSKP
jgi:hypothetical protein